MKDNNMHEVIVFNGDMLDLITYDSILCTAKHKNILITLRGRYNEYNGNKRFLKYITYFMTSEFQLYCRTQNIKVKKHLVVNSSMTLSHSKIKLTYLFVNKNDALKFKIIFADKIKK